MYSTHAFQPHCTSCAPTATRNVIMRHARMGKRAETGARTQSPNTEHTYKPARRRPCAQRRERACGRDCLAATASAARRCRHLRSWLLPPSPPPIPPPPPPMPPPPPPPIRPSHRVPETATTADCCAPPPPPPPAATGPALACVLAPLTSTHSRSSFWA
jgi:hypothetical protein